MLFVTTQVGVHTLASRMPSSLSVTTMWVLTSVGDHAIRTTRIGLLALACSASALHVAPSQVRVFGLLMVLLPVFQPYAMVACLAVLSQYPAKVTQLFCCH